MRFSMLFASSASTCHHHDYHRRRRRRSSVDTNRFVLINIPAFWTSCDVDLDGKIPVVRIALATHRLFFSLQVDLYMNGELTESQMATPVPDVAEHSVKREQTPAQGTEPRRSECSAVSPARAQYWHKRMHNRYAWRENGWCQRWHDHRNTSAFPVKPIETLELLEDIVTPSPFQCWENA